MKTILVDARNTFILEDGINQEMKTLLDTYPNRKIILTNANEEERKKIGIVDMPYEVFSLSHNPNKTDPVYYETMLHTLSLDSNDVVYFEHNKEAIESAKSLGITTHHYDKDTKDIQSLKTFLDNNV